MSRCDFHQSVVRAAAGATLAVMLGAPAIAVAQQKPLSLAEIARQERERRSHVQTPSKVFTEKDVKPLPQPAPAPDAAPADPAAGEAPQAGAEVKAADAETKPAAASAAEAQGEAWWRARISDAREGLRRSKVFADALESRINAMTSDTARRDDPAQRQVLIGERDAAIQEMGRVRADIEKFEKQIASIEEEARLSNVPPGWLR